MLLNITTYLRCTAPSVVNIHITSMQRHAVIKCTNTVTLRMAATGVTLVILWLRVEYDCGVFLCGNQ